MHFGELGAAVKPDLPAGRAGHRRFTGLSMNGCWRSGPLQI